MVNGLKKHIIFLILFIAIAPLFALCLKAQFRVCLFKAAKHSLL